MHIALAVVPSLILMAWFHRRDAYPEPQKVVWATAGLGVLTIPAVLLVVSAYGRFIDAVDSPFLYGLLASFLCAAVPEEFFKLLVVLAYAARLRDFDEPMDGVVYGVAASLGFATLENILYVAEGGLHVALVRAVTSVPGHALFGAVMGLHVGRAKFDPDRANRHLVCAFLWPVLLHGLYDLPLLWADAVAESGAIDGFPSGWLLLVPVVLLGSTIWVWRRTGELRTAQQAMMSGPDAERPEDLTRAGSPSLWRRLAVVGGRVLLSTGLLSTGLFVATWFGADFKAGERGDFLFGALLLTGPQYLVAAGLAYWGRRR